MTTEDIKVLMIMPGEKPRQTTIKNSLRGLQEAVGGEIEMLDFTTDDNVTIVCNAMGKLEKMTPNRVIDGEFVHDIIFGPFFIASLDGKGNLASLTNSQFSRYEKQFLYPESIMMIAGNMLMVRIIDEKGGEADE